VVRRELAKLFRVETVGRALYIDVQEFLAAARVRQPELDLDLVKKRVLGISHMVDGNINLSMGQIQGVPPEHGHLTIGRIKLHPSMTFI
jgi:hypothetical protein